VAGRNKFRRDEQSDPLPFGRGGEDALDAVAMTTPGAMAARV
jgi:hypothetical protein